MSTSSAAAWLWDTSGAVPVVSGYPSGGPTSFTQTKTGLMPSDLQAFVGVPLVDYNSDPPVPIDNATIIKWIRWAEDYVESKTGLLLSQTWVASPPAVTPAETQALGITPTFSGGYQQLGYDYDLEDAAYDFFYPRARDEGWMIYSLRYKPVKDTLYGPFNPTAIKQITYIYPLLNEFFRVPWQWQVEDHDAGLIRLVPATNVQMLPLFAMQLAFMGFAESVPGGIWMQYKAGLTPNDYNSRFSFVLQLVLAQAAWQGLSAIQGTVSLGGEEYKMTVDGMQYSTKYGKTGPFGFMIDRFEKMRDDLLAQAINKVAGPVLSTV